MKEIASLLLIGLALFTLAYAEPNEEAKCSQRVEEAVKKLNVLYASRHLSPIPFDPSQPDISQQYEFSRQLNVWNFYFAPTVNMECLPVSHDIIYFSRDDLYEHSPLSSNKPVPIWTLDQAAEEAKPWVQAVLGYFPSNLSALHGSFNVEMRDAKRYYGGRWLIRWQRTDSQGHIFDMDGLTVFLSETYGLIGCSLNFDSTYDENHGRLISEEEALAAARSPAETLLNDHNLSMVILPPGLRLGSGKADLYIVNPNNFFQHKATDRIVTSLTARLAWVIKYSLMNGDNPAPYAVIVRIDAQTKEVLGGDFLMGIVQP
jgi:hypothetical protein